MPGTTHMQAGRDRADRRRGRRPRTRCRRTRPRARRGARSARMCGGASASLVSTVTASGDGAGSPAPSAPSRQSPRRRPAASPRRRARGREVAARPSAPSTRAASSDGGGDVVQLEVEEHVVAEVEQRADGVGPDGAEELEADLGHAEPRPQLAGQAQRRRRGRRRRGRARAGRGPRSLARHSVMRSLRSGRRRRARRGAAHHVCQLVEHPPAAPGDRRRWPCRPATALRPGEQQLDGVDAACDTPPTPTIGRSGSAACTSYTARTATGWMAGPDSPPPPVAEPRRPARSRRRWPCPSTVLTSVTASAPAPRRGPGDRRRGR